MGIEMNFYKANSTRTPYPFFYTTAASSLLEPLTPATTGFKQVYSIRH